MSRVATVLTPTIGPAARLFMGEIVPGVAVRDVILAHRAPLALADIGTPAAPILDAGIRLVLSISIALLTRVWRLASRVRDVIGLALTRR